ncbi:MAG: hypothetical protein EXR62_06810 [Chloroflexi bacterium]|nr:hypothetical protein [Chloroflexota bacterium]
MVKICPVCGAENRGEAQFCFACAANLSGPVCAACSQVNLPGSRYCSQCAASLNGSGPLADTVLSTGSQTLLAGRYLVETRLGKGGMGAVYRVSDQLLEGKQWAVKEFSDTQLGDEAERRAAINAFQQEARILARLDHPNLPKVTNFFTSSGKQYLVMDYVEGKTLQTILDESPGPLPERIVREFALQICDVLEYLHKQEHPIIFRDLKPANIMLDITGTIKLIDFGIVRLFKPGKVQDTTAFGSPGFAPPEQYGKGQTDPRSDIYAFGATLHNLLTKRDPAESPMQFPPLRRLNPSISDDMDRLVNKAIQIKAEDRWHSVTEMHQVLLATPRTTARVTDETDRQQPQWRRKTAPVPPSPPPRQPSPVRVLPPPAKALKSFLRASWRQSARRVLVTTVLGLVVLSLKWQPAGLSDIAVILAGMPVIMLLAYSLTRRPGTALVTGGLLGSFVLLSQGGGDIQHILTSSGGHPGILLLLQAVVLEVLLLANGYSSASFGDAISLLFLAMGAALIATNLLHGISGPSWTDFPLILVFLVGGALVNSAFSGVGLH